MRCSVVLVAEKCSGDMVVAWVESRCSKAGCTGGTGPGVDVKDSSCISVETASVGALSGVEGESQWRHTKVVSSQLRGCTLCRRSSSSQQLACCQLPHFSQATTGRDSAGFISSIVQISQRRRHASVVFLDSSCTIRSCIMRSLASSRSPRSRSRSSRLFCVCCSTASRITRSRSA